ncbi:MAG: gfo/Idh/MocA family oxidoreductase, partial [Maribacter sp.]
MKNISRRNFNGTLSKGILGSALIGTLPLVKGFGVAPQKKKLGVALVGLGSYSSGQLAPALLDTEYCYL